MKRLLSGLKNGIFFRGWADALLCLAAAAAVYFVSGVYDRLNHGPYSLFLLTPLDSIIPLVKIFVIPYISLNLYVYATLIFFMLFRSEYFKSAALSMITLFIVSYVFYFFFQSYVARPQIQGNDWLSELIRGVYASDNPYNDFPSLHTSISTIIAFHWLKFDRRAGIPCALWTALIILSTLFIKQHYIADAAAGLALALSASYLYTRVFRAFH
jgi:membrane-associated phospholipid phosphatase